MEKSNKILSDITVYMKYAKFVPELNRRETWSELVDRNKAMHVKKYPKLEKQIDEAYELVYDKKILPSMRSLQFGGKSIEISPNRVYNCAYLPIDSVDSFNEIMFLLLGGTGVGYSVQNHHVSQLPSISKPHSKRTKRFLIGDSIEGWADAIKVLMKSYMGDKRNSKVDFDYSDIRPKGAQLVTSGGKAPGPQPLKECVFNITAVLDSKKDGENLTTVETHDIVCHIADAVLAGGIRRAALIALFSADDDDMISCKSGSWWESNPQRGRANNSAVLMRHKVTEEFFMNLWKRVELSNAGEPGIYFNNDKDWGTNPCCFSGDTIVATADGRNGVTIAQLAEESQGKESFPVYSAREKYTNKIFVYDNKFQGWKSEIKQAVAYHNGYKETVEVCLSDGSKFKCTDDHRLALPSGGWVEAKDSVGLELEKFFSFSNKNNKKSYRHINSKSNGYSKQYRMMWEFHNGSYNNSRNIDHIDEDSTNDKLENLELILAKDNLKKRALNMNGMGNPVHKLNKRHLQLRGSRNSIAANGKRWGWSTDKIEKTLIDWNRKHKEEYDSYAKEDINVDLSEAVYVTELVYTGEKEDVYDLTVEDNENFYILTKTDDDNYLNSSGVLVHNCEIALRPFQFCNLCEVNASNIESQEDLNNRVKHAAFIGTLQAGYTEFHYLRSIWRETTEKDALIGVSMTGIGSGAVLNYDMTEAAEVVNKENSRVAKLIGINAAARTTTVKPAGTTSLALGTSSGIHAWHNDYYIRRIRVGKNESMYQYLSKNHPELVEDEYFRPHDTAVISIPQKAPKGSILRDESPFDLLERIKKVAQEWVVPGHRKGSNTHNVSATVSLKADEWDRAGEWMWANRNHYNGLSVLPYDGGTYIQAPFEDISEADYHERMKHLVDVDLINIIEVDDDTNLAGEIACGGGGSCEVK